MLDVLLLAASLLPAHQDPIQDDGPGAFGVEERTELQRQFDRLQLQWEHAIFDYIGDRRAALRGGASEEDLPKHPADKYWGRFEDVAKQGCIEAWLWMSEHFYAAFEPEYVAPIGESVYKHLLDAYANDPLAVQIAKNLEERGRDLGLDPAIGFTKRLIEESELVEVQAQGLDTLARLMIRRAKDTGERVPGEVREIWTTLVAGYPGTEIARNAAGRLYNRTEAELLEDYATWMDAVEAAHGQGLGPDSWPTFPAHEYLHTFTPLSGVGYVPATAWIETFYRPWAQVERRDRLEALSYFCQSISNRYLPHLQDWTRLMFRVLRFQLYEHGDAVWIPELLGDFEKKASAYDQQVVIETFEPLLEGPHATDDPVQVTYALWILAQAYVTRPSWDAYQRAMGYYERLRDEHPDTVFASKSQLALARAAHAGIGQPARHLANKDQEGQEFSLEDYRGTVVILHFGGFWNEDWVAQIDVIRELLKGANDRRLDAISITTDYLDKRNMRRKARDAKLRWRYIQEYWRDSALLVDWNVLAFPTVIVVDAEGVIRARNLPWKETLKLMDELVLEAEEKYGPK